MEEKLDEIIALLTQLPDTLHSFMLSKGEDEPDSTKEGEPDSTKEDEPESTKDDESENKEKDLGTDYLDF